MWSVMGASDTHLVRGEDGITRCFWGANPEIYREYHDREWGFPVADDRRLFEKLCLEGFQSGLSWLTILKKRENFRAAFAGFDFHHVARFTEREVTGLLGDAHRRGGSPRHSALTRAYGGQERNGRCARRL
jgi:DNA-3-methyladenine glycosylase I